VIGRAGGIARAVVLAAREAGAQAIAAGRDETALAGSTALKPVSGRKELTRPTKHPCCYRQKA
jgi:hypothetical protein